MAESDESIRLFQMLVEAGAKPGEDFSYDLQKRAIQISDRAFKKLQTAHPEIDWASISQRVEIDPDVPAKCLNRYLGVDFVEEILKRIERRVDELPASQAAWYLQQVFSGVEQRTNVPLYVLMQRRLSLTKQALIETLLRQETTPCHIWMRDLIEAAGGSPDDVELEGDGATLTQQGLNLLTSVWTGEYDLLEDAPES